MRQQIDLYQDILIDRPEPLQRRQTGYIILIAVIGLILVSGFSYRQTVIAKAERNELLALVQIDNQRVTDLERQYPEIKMNVLLKEKIVRLEQEIRGQHQAVNYFSDQDVESNTDILATLDSLAKTPFKGVWLKRIRLLKRGEEVLLAGSALTAEQVPDYLAELGSQHVFGGRLFSRLQLNRVEKLDGQVDFLLESSQEEGL
jgi:hypothetical protein